MEYQLRMYTVHPGRMNDWLEEWAESVYPLRLEFGFELVGAWVIEETDTFVWILGWKGDGDLDDADRRYYEWPERAAVTPNPARHLAKTEHFAIHSALPTY
jgi:hypothetical protein